ncbi:MAG: GTP 3',8-cyclase MoaA [Planctomycetota bacterium]|nr:MAG: GTP 3',8-cyclase MoaA [Planctomycetota bacterium]
MHTIDQLKRPLKDLRLSVIDACNFRCNYCMPAEKFKSNYKFLKKSELLSWDELFLLTKIFVDFGIEKLRLTGGEPLLRKGLADFIKKVKNETNIKQIALTTNGYYLKENAKQLKASGLDRLTVSVDSINENTFAKLTGQHETLPIILDGIKEAINVGFSPIKINAVIQKGINEHEILELANHFKKKETILRFIEYMDVGTINNWDDSKVLFSSDILSQINEFFPLQPLEAQYYGEVANRYEYTDQSGEIGFISSISQPFCQNCTRARVTSDGKFYTCLFASSGVSLRKILRSHYSDKHIQQKLIEKIADSWAKREDRYSEDRHLKHPKQPKTEMYQLGG